MSKYTIFTKGVAGHKKFCAHWFRNHWTKGFFSWLRIDISVEKVLPTLCWPVLNQQAQDFNDSKTTGIFNLKVFSMSEIP